MSFGVPVKASKFKRLSLTSKTPSIVKKRVEMEEEEIVVKHIPQLVVEESTTEDEQKDNITDVIIPEEEDEEDALEAFMSTVDTEIKELESADAIQLEIQAKNLTSKKLQEWLDQEIEGDEEPEPEIEINYQEIMVAAADQVRKKDMLDTDHSTVEYEEFRKDFYKEPPDVAIMTQKEADDRRIELDGIKVRGKRCPKPVERWSQFGNPPGVDDVIKKILKYERPSPIQAQAIPAIMSGRDVIGTARTGSGKVKIY